ncbi:aminoacyl-tRNA deacylase [Yaniella halotolerans]|uniref:aminoacyl-tRNA deacylase n=1 Tax=Yaniella halotolerans TaxID=225453 RepID=UPI0003B6DC7E|nr:aminoacyl-tRNA deacylase [Yaniella halotolerans]
MSTSSAATPAVRTVLEADLWHQVFEYEHNDDDVRGFGAEAADKLGADPQRILKTLVVRTSDGRLANAVLAVADMLNLKRVAKALKVKSVKMAEPAQVQQKTGYVLGGVSPLGQKTSLPMVVDSAVKRFDTVIVSGGQRGMSLELKTQDFLELSNATVVTIRR